MGILNMLKDFKDKSKDTSKNKAISEQVEDIELAKKRFKDSAIQAREAGVPEDKILKTKEDIDNYFMN